MAARLLHRTTRRVALTEDGENVLQWAQKILDDAEQMAASVVAAKATPRGLLRISTSTGYGRNRVAPALSEWVRQYPSVKVQLELLDRPVDLIGEGFDLDIRVGGRPEPNLIAKRICTNYRVLCASPDYLSKYGTPACLADLTHHNCLVIRERDQVFGVWRLNGPRRIETVKVDGSMSASNGEIVHRWALDGHGIILRSVWDVETSLKEGRLVRVLSEYQQDAHVFAVYSSRLSGSAKVRLCLQFLEQRLNAPVPHQRTT